MHRRIKSYYYITLLAVMLLGMTITGYTSDNHNPARKTLLHKVGETQVRIICEQYGPVKSTVFVHLHGDEETSLLGSRRVLASKGGLLVRIDNPGKRNIRFRLHGRYYSFDPNRIFSRAGIEQTLRSFGRYSTEARQQVEKFASRLLAQFPAKTETIIALHNNSDGLFSVLSYQPGNERSNDARAVHHNDEHDEDDLFYTTDSTLFAELQKSGFNSIWQHNSRARRDGSLSIYCGERNIRYLNCETEHGKTSQYELMIAHAVELIHSPKTKKGTPVAVQKKTSATVQPAPPQTVIAHNTGVPAVSAHEISPLFRRPEGIIPH